MADGESATGAAMSKFDRIDKLCARRAQNGIKEYGCLDLATDPRDFSREAQEELLDAINYVKWAMARGDMSIVEGAVILHFIKGIYRMLI